VDSTKAATDDSTMSSTSVTDDRVIVSPPMISRQNAQQEMANHAMRLTITAVLKAAHSLVGGGAVGGRVGTSGGSGGAGRGNDAAKAAAWTRRTAI
jgi:hypothetical protein